MLSGENLVTSLHDEPVALVVKPAACVIGGGSGFLEDGVRRDHLARDEVMPDAEVLERTLRLRPPQLVAGHIDFTEAVGLFSNLLLIQVADRTHRFSSS